VEAFFVYILTNSNRSVLYIGITNDLQRRVYEHYEYSLVEKGFTGKYKIYHLIYFEEFADPMIAIEREKQLKGWTRKKKEALIATKNPNWEFLETEI
jgi:putative endonuclease